MGNISWPVTDDVPDQAQRSSTSKVRFGKYDTLHQFMVNNRTKENFMTTHGPRDPPSPTKPNYPGPEKHAKLNYHKSTMRPVSRSARSQEEAEGDLLFQA